MLAEATLPSGAICSLPSTRIALTSSYEDVTAGSAGRVAMAGASGASIAASTTTNDANLDMAVDSILCRIARLPPAAQA